MPNILIADDNKQIVSILSEYAKIEGFDVLTASDGKMALDIFQKTDIDLLLLDIMMPVIDGLEVCRQIRKKSNVPIIMITAKGEDFDRIMGLDIGADDYIVKPFSPAEVMARVRAIMRRITHSGDNEENQKSFQCGSLNISLNTFTASIDDVSLSLTKKEIELLWTLATNSGKVFTRDNLLDSVWGYDYLGDSRTVDSHIKRLRAKTDKYTHPDWKISTVWGTGYKFEVIPNEN